MTNLNHLAEVMETEAELTGQLVELMKQQQKALVNLDAVAVESTVDQQQELLLPLEALEQERIRLTNEVWKDIVQRGNAKENPVTIATLLQHLASDQAKRLSAASNALRGAIETMMKENYANQSLIEHSRKFVRETFRIVTEACARPLVDQKI